MAYIYQRETELGKVLAQVNLELDSKRTRMSVGSLGAYLVVTTWDNAAGNIQGDGINQVQSLDHDLRAILALVMGMRDPGFDHSGVRSILL